MKSICAILILLSYINSSIATFVSFRSTVTTSVQTSALFYKDESVAMEESNSEEESNSVPTSNPTITLNAEALKAKAELLNLADITKRGFSASQDQRKRVNELAKILEKYNPTSEPASPFYKDPPTDDFLGPTICGKWTLMYTDAPDITSLDGGPFATAKLGRIGQECSPPFIKNVIEWKRPNWAKTLPFSGTDESKVLQKVACEGQASREDPLIVDLKIAGLDLLGVSGFDKDGLESSGGDNPSATGGPGKFFEENPVELRGLFRAPFGKFKILYLDEDMRVTRTGQNFLTVNVRNEQDWF